MIPCHKCQSCHSSPAKPRDGAKPGGFQYRPAGTDETLDVPPRTRTRDESAAPDNGEPILPAPETKPQNTPSD